jgi:hypothetical protein
MANSIPRRRSRCGDLGTCRSPARTNISLQPRSRSSAPISEPAGHGNGAAEDWGRGRTPPVLGLPGRRHVGHRRIPRLADRVWWPLHFRCDFCWRFHLIMWLMRHMVFRWSPQLIGDDNRIDRLSPTTLALKGIARYAKHRTGLAAALFELTVMHKPAEIASGQLSFRYGHFPWLMSETDAMDKAFWRVAAPPK